MRRRSGGFLQRAPDGLLDLVGVCAGLGDGMLCQVGLLDENRQTLLVLGQLLLCLRVLLLTVRRAAAAPVQAAASGRPTRLTARQAGQHSHRTGQGPDRVTGLRGRLQGGLRHLQLQAQIA